MKKNTHPLLIETKIQTKDGALYKKKWVFFKNNLPLEIDICKQSLWKKDSKKINIILKNNANNTSIN